MAKLFVANIGYQVQQFLFRLPENPKLLSITIPCGEQREIVDDQPEILDAVIEQHARYGMLSVREVLRTQRPTALIYNIGKPVQIDRMMEVDQENRRRMGEEAFQMRKLMAGVSLKHIQEEDYKANQRGPRAFEFTVVEETARVDDKPSIEETFIMPRAS